jgi:hypothetical protein
MPKLQERTPKATWTTPNFGNYVVYIFIQSLLKKRKGKGRGSKWNAKNFDTT